MRTKSGTGIVDLLRLSARIGQDPLLVQASSGNTSIKIDGVLWIKASGKWLARSAEEGSFIPVDLANFRDRMPRPMDRLGTDSGAMENPLGASIETSMHATLPHNVVVHVHSVNTIAWAIRRDGPEQLAQKLAGLQWQWISYAPSGLPLAYSIERALASSPHADVFVLGNHGLVVCAEDCTAVEALLREVENRVSVPPRRGPEWDGALTREIAGCPCWILPETEDLHALGTDPVTLRILNGGILYPCQALFLGATLPVVPGFGTLKAAIENYERLHESSPFLIVEGRGIVLNKEITRSERAVLNGLLQVVQRIPESAPIRYFENAELDQMLSAEACHYRQQSEANASSSASA